MVRTARKPASDKELLARTAGDPEAFGVFYDRFEAGLLGFFLRPTGRGRQRGSRGVRGGARVRGHVRPPARPCKAWPVDIARHELADTWQRRRVEDRARRRLGLEALALTDDAPERVEPLAGEPSEAPALLEDLRDDQRAAVEGRVLQEREHPELAAALTAREALCAG
jgi:RNA polymerase sigma-70 factor (ECF subfamily)